jgi:hypothetical protein
MPVSVKPFDCVECHTKNPNDFYGGRKTLCKKHVYQNRKDGKKSNVLKSYICTVCGETDESKFHKYNKSKCKKHFNTKSSAKESSPSNSPTPSESSDDKPKRKILVKRSEPMPILKKNKDKELPLQFNKEMFLKNIFSSDSDSEQEKQVTFKEESKESSSDEDEGDDDSEDEGDESSDED